jgi:hypothetical protein
MSKPATQAERLTRIETLLETLVETKLDAMAADIKSIKAEVEADKAELKALKNKGAGILIGVGLAGGAIGATVSGFIQALGGLFK